MSEHDIVVRPVTAADIDRVVEIHAAVAAEGRWIGREAPVPIDEVTGRMTDGLADPSRVHVVATIDEVVVGHAGGIPNGAGHLDLFMSIEDGHRGQGIGGRLLDEVVGWARDRSEIHKVVLQVWPHNEAAIALYRSRSFMVEGYRHQHWRRANGELWDAIEMALLVGS
jgi:RimJ/RimL family protein N-acetyltransferase